MLDIWFKEKSDSEKEKCSNHESFRFHLNDEKSKNGVLIFTDFDQDSKICYGLDNLTSHFHSGCRYTGSLRSSSDKFVSQASYEFLNSEHYLPVLISENSRLQCIKAGLDDEKHISRKVFIDNKVNLDFSDSEKEIAETGFLGVQKHFTEQHQWTKCEEQSYNFLRLGKLKNQLDVAESIIRDAEYVEFNINAIKHSDLSSNKNAPITGLTIEEACQLMKYIGLANNLKFLSINGYDPNIDQDGKIGECIAMMLWYFIEGRESRTEYFEGLNKTDFQEYLVQPSHLPISLKFFKHNISGQWWVKLPEELDEKEMVLACSKRDYFQACNDEVSERLMQAISVM